MEEEKKIYTFEDKLPEIMELLEKNRHRYSLTAVTFMDYDDVKQIILSHLAKKFGQWQQSLKFRPWANKTIIHQILNQVRNHYYAFQRPCLKCPHNLGNNFCALNKSGMQDSSECSEFSKWEKTRKRKNDIKLPLPIEQTAAEHFEAVPYYDYERAEDVLHQKILERLIIPRQKEIYRLLHMENRSDQYVAELYGFKPEPKRKSLRYKQIKNLKKKFVELAREITREEGWLED